MRLFCSSGKSAWRNWFFSFFTYIFISFSCFARNFKLTSLRGELKESSASGDQSQLFRYWSCISIWFPSQARKARKARKAAFSPQENLFWPFYFTVVIGHSFSLEPNPKVWPTSRQRKIKQNKKKISFPSQSKIGGTWTGDISTIWSVINKYSLIALQSFNKSTFTPSLLYFSVNLVSYLNLITIYVNKVLEHASV